MSRVCFERILDYEVAQQFCSYGDSTTCCCLPFRPEFHAFEQNLCFVLILSTDGSQGVTREKCADDVDRSVKRDLVLDRYY